MNHPAQGFQANVASGAVELAQPLTDDILNRMNNLNVTALEVMVTAQTIKSKLFGSFETKGDERAPPAPVPNGFSDSFQMARHELQSRLAVAEAALNEINSRL
jgi:hypothetical protein